MALRSGDRWRLGRVKSGALKDVEGVVLQHEQRHKLWLGVTALGVGATVEIHPDLVDPC